MAEAPEAEAHDPAYTPGQAQSRAAIFAGALAKTTAWPAISRAACALDLDTLRRELAAGAAVDTLVALVGPNDEVSHMGGRTPLQLVCETTNESIVYQRGGTEEAFVGWAASPPNRRREIDEGIHADRIACASLLLKHGASPNPGGCHFQPLMGAALKGNLEVVNMLLAAGSDANAPWRSGSHTLSPLFMVVLSNCGGKRPAIAGALLKAGADANPPEFPESSGKTLMMWAIRDGDHRIWPVLLRGGAILPPPRELNWAGYDTHRAHPYLRKIDAAGGWTAHEKAHRATLQAIFAPKFTHLLPPELVARIVEYSFHLGFY